MNYRTISDLSTLIRKNLHLIPQVDCVAGIPRSGMLAASQIAVLTNQPLASVGELITNSWHDSRHGGRWERVSPVRSILLVDDSISGGETFKNILPDLKDFQVITLAVFRKPSAPPVDIHFEICPSPHVWEWNWFKHPSVKHAVLDMDGVICTETIPGQRDKGFPLFLPQREVLAIATGRDESERKATEYWLERHHVRYGKLFMSPPKQSGKLTKLIAAKETGAKWIVESDEQQALWLKAQTGLPVLCTDTNRML